MLKFLLLLLLGVFSSGYGEKSSDLIIFSYNRPMQLYALLKSVSMNVSNLNQTFVLYRVGNAEIATSYEELKELFPHIQFVKQGSHPRQDFKPLLLQCFTKTEAEYILFAVDDDIVKEPFDMKDCIDAMEESGAYCLFLRLGENITKQYNQNEVQLRAPPSIEMKNGIYKYYMNDGCYGDWRYCNNVDMTVYKKESIYPFFSSASYHSPNTLEGNWAGVQNLNAYGLYFKTSKMFSLPINIVQEDWINPYEGTFTAQELFKLWQEGFEMDLMPYLFLENSCAFVSLKPTFTKRK